MLSSHWSILQRPMRYCCHIQPRQDGRGLYILVLVVVWEMYMYITCCCVNLMWIRCEYKLNEMQTIQLFVYNKGHTSISILKSLLKQWYIKIAQYIKIYSLFFDSTSQEREVNFQKFKNLSVNLVGIIKVSGLSKTTDHELIESAWDFCFYIYWIKIFENQHFKTKIAYFSPIWLKFYTIMHITIYYIQVIYSWIENFSRCTLCS